MSQISSIFGNLPGESAIVETYEQKILFGINAQVLWWNGYIDANAVDSGNSPTYRLRPGLLLGIITSTGKWTNYSPTATDGSEVASGILAYGMRMQDVLTGTNVEKFYAIVVGGRVKGANILNLDNMARGQMSSRFTFDDNLSGNQWFPFKRFQTKATDYVVVAADNFTEFLTTGAVGAVNFTLPTIANGYAFRFRNMADQNLTVTSAEGTNMVALNNLSASSVAFSTGGAKIGGGFLVYSNAAATKWIVQTTSAGANTVTVA